MSRAPREPGAVPASRQTPCPGRATPCALVAALCSHALTLSACGAAPLPSTTNAEAQPIIPPSRPCTLAEGRWSLALPVPPQHALAVADDACLLVDERREATFVSLASLPVDAEGAELLADDPDEFFRRSGLLGDEARLLGTAPMTLLGSRLSATRWTAELPGLGPREVYTAVLRRGADWLLVMVVSALGDAEAQEHLRDLLSESSAR